MTDNNQRPEPKNLVRPVSRPGQPRDDRLIGEAHDIPKKRPVVGEDVADESKERHTEIAVEEGHRGRGDRDER